MPEFFGVTGKILRIDLSSEKTSVIEPGEDVYKQYLGGIGLGMYYLYKEGVMAPDLKPFDPKNLWQYMIGPFNGLIPGSRSAIITKSPYNFNALSYSGGAIAAELKFSGWDGIQLTGKAKDLIWLSIVDDKVGFNDATNLRGKKSDETEFLLKTRDESKSPLEYRKRRVLTRDNLPVGTDASGNKVSMWDWWGVRANPDHAIGEKLMSRFFSIGPAGEKGVWYSALVTEGPNVAGRLGTGAILGSKNVKAISIRGTQGHKFYDKQKVLDAIRNTIAAMKLSASNRTYGTAGIPSGMNNRSGGYPIRNYQYTAWQDPRAVTGLNGAFLDDMSWVKHKNCCSVGCQICVKTSRVTSDDPQMDGAISDMPDWEAQGDVGGLFDCVVTADQFPGKTPADPYTGTLWDKVEAGNRCLYLTALYDALGMDYIEGGNHIAMMMELRQRNLITREDLKLPAEVGDLIWGNYKAAAWVMTQIATSDDMPWPEIRKGTWETAQYFARIKNNPRITYYAQCIKRYGQPAHDPRNGRDSRIDGYQQSEKPASHTEGYGAGVCNAAGVVCLVMCSFASGSVGGPAVFGPLVQSLTGWPYTQADFTTLGERVFNMERAFNIITQEITNPATQWDDLWPRRWLEPMPTGWARGTTQVTEAAVKNNLATFYKDRGWDDRGFPTADTLQKYGLTYVDDLLKKYRGS